MRSARGAAPRQAARVTAFPERTVEVRRGLAEESPTRESAARLDLARLALLTASAMPPASSASLRASESLPEPPVGKRDASAASGERADAELEAIVLGFVEGQAKIARRALHAIAVSEQAALNVGDHVGAIVRHAREHVEASTRLAVRFGKDSEIGRAIARHSEDMTAFVDGITRRLREQRARAAELHDQLEGILSAGKRIRAIARETKIVTINAQIEAARLGAQGKPFVVIAEQLAQLADDVDVANQLVGRLAQTMTEVMPRLAESAESLLGESERFRERFSAGLAELERTQAELHDDVVRAVREGERRSARILEGSRNALSELQFQDPMAQSLREIPRISDAARRRLVEALGVDVDAVDVLEARESLRVGELMARLAGAEEVALRSVPEEPSPDGMDAGAPESGDVLLF